MAYPILTGFGSNPDDPNTLVYFHVEADRSNGMYGDWAATQMSAIHQIVSTNQYDVHVMGYGPATLTLSLFFDTRNDFASFRSKLGTEDTLQLVDGYTHHDDVTVKHINGHDYARYPATLLHRIEDIRFQVGGRVECTAVFMREETLT